MTASAHTAEFLLIAGPAALSALACVIGSLALLRVNTLIDAPNERSSHSVPASRAGGVAIFISWAIGALVLIIFSGLEWRPPAAIDRALAGLFLGAALAFGAGLLDDRQPQRAVVKLGAQAVAAALFIGLAGPLLSAPVPFIGSIDLGPAAGAVTLFWIVAFMNAYNFMDGLNGIAASCAAAVLAAIAIAAALWGLVVLSGLAAALAGSLAGFLPVNMRSGRLFMGDSGSQFTGFLIAALAVLLANGSQGRVSIYFAPVAFAPFLFDVAFTLISRLRRRQNIFAAHREHIYQQLAHGGLGHSTVTGLYFGLTTLSIAVATLTVLLSPADQWLPAAALLVCFAAPAGLTVRKRQREASAGARD